MAESESCLGTNSEVTLSLDIWYFLYSGSFLRDCGAAGDVRDSSKWMFIFILSYISRECYLLEVIDYKLLQ